MGGWFTLCWLVRTCSSAPSLWSHLAGPAMNMSSELMGEAGKQRHIKTVTLFFLLSAFFLLFSASSFVCQFISVAAVPIISFGGRHEFALCCGFLEKRCVSGTGSSFDEMLILSTDFYFFSKVFKSSTAVCSITPNLCPDSHESLQSTLGKLLLPHRILHTFCIWCVVLINNRCVLAFVYENSVFKMRNMLAMSAPFINGIICIS